MSKFKAEITQKGIDLEVRILRSQSPHGSKVRGNISKNNSLLNTGLFTPIGGGVIGSFPICSVAIVLLFNPAPNKKEVRYFLLRRPHIKEQWGGEYGIFHKKTILIVSV